MNPCFYRNTGLALAAWIATAFLVSGCALYTGSAPSREDASATATPPASADAPAAASQAQPRKPTALYHDFEDVLVPMELKVVRDRTVIVSTPGFRSGILTLRGMVESNSLFNFFSNHMEEDNWQVLSKIKSPGTTIMVFQKPDKCAVITIRDGQLNTYVEIGVAPSLGGRMDKSATSLTY